MVTPGARVIQPLTVRAAAVLGWEQRKEHDMDDTTADDRSDEVVTEFDQTNDKVQGLEGDGGDIDDVEGDRSADPDFEMGPSAVGDGSADGHREPLITRVVDGLDGESDEERRD